MRVYEEMQKNKTKKEGKKVMNARYKKGIWLCVLMEDGVEEDEELEKVGRNFGTKDGNWEKKST